MLMTSRNESQPFIRVEIRSETSSENNHHCHRLAHQIENDERQGQNKCWIFPIGDFYFKCIRFREDFGDHRGDFVVLFLDHERIARVVGFVRRILPVDRFDIESCHCEYRSLFDNGQLLFRLVRLSRGNLASRMKMKSVRFKFHQTPSNRKNVYLVFINR